MSEPRTPLYFPCIKEFRLKHNKTQQQIANILHCQREVYRRYECGNRELPVWALLKLADYYHTTTDDILGQQKK